MADSNRLSISLPKGVYKKLEERAHKEGRNVSSLASVLIERMMLEDEKNQLWVETMAHYQKRLTEEKQASAQRIAELQSELDEERSKLDITLPIVIKSPLLKTLSGEELSDLELSVLCDFFGYDQRLLQQARSTQDKSLVTEERTADERGEEFTETEMP